MRSKLFVPGSQPALFAKAMASDADALSFDLEDAVAEAGKARARAAVGEWLRSPGARAGGKTLIVRTNAVGSAHFQPDLAAVALPGLHLINLPKVSSADEVCEAAAALAAAEAANGVERPIGLLLTIETPAALRRAHVLAGVHPRVSGLQLGLADLFEPLQVSRADTRAVHAAMFALRLAAGEAGVFAVDAAYADLRDAEGFRVEARVARDLGFVGKSCIHPSQVPLANEVFSPTAAEIAHALAVVAAADEAHRQGRGAFVVDGRMIDRPFERRARALLAQAERLRLLPT